jgi:hypothetical protein
MMEAVSTSKMLDNFYETTQCNISEDSYLPKNISVYKCPDIGKPGTEPEPSFSVTFF